MNGPNDVENLIAAMKPGDAAVSLAGGHGSDAVFLIRERSAVIKYFGETGVAVRAGRFTCGAIEVAAVAFRLGHAVPMVYAILLDYCSEEGPGIFGSLVRQEYIPLYFHGDNGRRDRMFIVLNPFQAFFTETADSIRARPPWKENDFRAAAAVIRGRCPLPEDLWAVLGEEKFRNEKVSGG